MLHVDVYAQAWLILSNTEVEESIQDAESIDTPINNRHRVLIFAQVSD